LVFFALGGDQERTDTFFQFCQELLVFSPLNFRELSHGGVDSVILSALASPGSFPCLGLPLTVRFTKALGRSLPEKLTFAFAESDVAGLFLTAIDATSDPELVRTLQVALTGAKTRDRNRFSIGTGEPFAVVSGLTADDFTPPLTVLSVSVPMLSMSRGP
jgi:hypothetical protein